MKMPEITFLQYTILGLLSGEVAGKDLRSELAKRGSKMSGPGFYQAMSRMEESGYVLGRYEERLIEGQRIRERRYRLSASGVKVWNGARRYCEMLAARSQGGLLHAGVQ